MSGWVFDPESSETNLRQYTCQQPETKVLLITRTSTADEPLVKCRFCFAVSFPKKYNNQRKPLPIGS